MDIIIFFYVDLFLISGDFYISFDCVVDNVKDWELLFEEEFKWVVIYGVLYFCGYGDKSEVEVKKMC